MQILKDEAVGRLNELGKVADHDTIFFISLFAKICVRLQMF